ncbi:MAG: 50S ribosomal protein L24 [Cyanobacteria bacterium P01_H01_bin.74]
MPKSNKNKSKLKSLPKHYHIKRGDTVVVTSGKDKGKTGTVKVIMRKSGKALVDGLNIITKAVKPDMRAGQQGGHISTEAPIYVCKLMLYDTKNSQASRARVNRNYAGMPVRLSKKSGESFDD